MSTSTLTGPRLSAIDLTGAPQLAVEVALQCETSSTSTSPVGLDTYSVPVAGSSARAVGNALPSLIVATGLAQPLVTDTLHVAPSTTVTAPPPAPPPRASPT
jgi:hypothetical protein